MLSKQLQRRFMLARPWFSLILSYAVSLMLAALFLRTTADADGLDYQAAFFSNSLSIALLFCALLIARPKPSGPVNRTLYVGFEYLLVALVFSLALILSFHHGWHLRSDAPPGFAAIAWGIAWLGGWLGPVVLSILALLGGHWLWLNVFIDYRSACWGFIQQARTARLLEQLLQALQQDHFLRPKDAEYVGRKLIDWHHVAKSRAKPFELSLPSSGVHLHGHWETTDNEIEARLVLQKRPTKHASRVLQSIQLRWPQEPAYSAGSIR